MAQKGALIAAYHRRRQTRQTAQRSCSPAGPRSLPASTQVSWREAVSTKNKPPWAPLERKPQSPPSCTHTPIRAYAVGARTPKCVFEGVTTSPTGGAGHQAAVSRGGGSRCGLTPAGHRSHMQVTHRVHMQVTHTGYTCRSHTGHTSHLQATQTGYASRTHRVHMQVTHRVHMQVTHRVHMQVTQRPHTQVNNTKATYRSHRLATQVAHKGHTLVRTRGTKGEHEIHAPVDKKQKHTLRTEARRHGPRRSRSRTD
jgi:hypothetical protein